jgi:hypothetical protein
LLKLQTNHTQDMSAAHLNPINVMLSGQDSQLQARGFGPMIQSQAKGVSKWDM